MFAYLIYWVPVFSGFASEVAMGSRTTDGMKSWTACVFENYNGDDDASWESECGASYKYKISRSRLAFGTIAFCFYSNLFVCVYYR
jgi:hypothetical protein